MCGMLPRSGVSQGNNRRNLYLSLAAFTYVHVHVPVCSVSTIQYDPATKLTADSLQSLEFPCHVYLMTDFLECVYRSSAVFIGGCRWSSEISSQWNMASKKVVSATNFRQYSQCRIDFVDYFLHCSTDAVFKSLTI